MLGSRLRVLRISNNLTQLDLAKKLNLSKANISKYETGIIEPNIDTLNKMSELFNVSVDYLLGRTDIPNMPTKTHETDTLGVTIMAMDGDGQEEIRVTKEQYDKIKKLLEILDNN